MAIAPKIDTTMRERRRILRLLDFLKRDDLTGEQMEKIGRRLQKSGKRALNPLVRKLWREKSGAAIYRYTCMLDFFDDSTWLEQLVKITLKRKDLEEDGKLALLDMLHECGIDVTAPPFASMTGYGAATLDGFVADCLADGERGLVRFVDSFLDLDDDARERMVRALVYLATPDAVALLYILTSFENRPIVLLAIKALGRVQNGYSRYVLELIQKQPEQEIADAAAYSLKRLSFLGVKDSLKLPQSYRTSLPIRDVQVGPINYYGNCYLWFSWDITDVERGGMLILINDDEGMVNANSYRMKDEKEYGKVLKEVVLDGDLLPVPHEYGIALLQGALYSSRQKQRYLPSDFYVDKRLFKPDLLKPVGYVPRFDQNLLEDIVEKIPKYITKSNDLLGELGLEGWIISEPLIYDAAERLLELEKSDLSDLEANKALENEIERFCRESIQPNCPELVKRVLLAADFMAQTGVESTIIQQTVATALSFIGGFLPLYRHPFIRQLVFDSIDMARQSLSQGYDPRLEEDYDDDE